MEDTIQWVQNAIQTIKAEKQRSSETNLLRIGLPTTPEITLYLKNESNHKTGSLKHRLARSLFLRALLRGHLAPGKTIIEASSGNTAVSEAFFAHLLNLPYIAVMSKSTCSKKIKRIEQLGGKCVLINSHERDVDVARALAADNDGYFINQFSSAKKVFGVSYIDNLSNAILEQMKFEPYPAPEWFVCGAGTGGTAQAFTESILKNNLSTKLCVVDPEFSVYFNCFMSGDRNLTCDKRSRIEGIGRRQVEASFNTSGISRMLKIPDEASIATMHFIQQITGLNIGGSTGTNIYGAFYLMSEMKLNHKPGSIVTVFCDSGMLYQDSYYSDAWLKQANIDITPYYQQLECFYETGIWKNLDSMDDSQNGTIA